mmetsp:Transcript_25490/g.46040  ORF Transcript_25490/g.46040 Transcript_25490/m.46040 type:complete len:82 (+) Transcript_25490:473-718(+)
MEVLTVVLTVELRAMEVLTVVVLATTEVLMVVVVVVVNPLVGFTNREGAILVIIVGFLTLSVLGLMGVLLLFQFQYMCCYS